MASKYTEEQLNSLDRETLTRLFLSQQEQLENIDHTLQLVLEQMADLKRHRFGRSSEKHEAEGQVSFMEVDGKIVFFNESEAVAAEESTEEPEDVSRTRPKKKQGKREEDLDGIPVVVVEHSMTDEELEDKFGKDGWKQLPDEVYRRYSFTPAKIEVEEHHVKVYAGKETEDVIKAPHPQTLLRGSLVSPSLEAAVMNAKYVNAVPLYRQEQEFERYGLHISRQNMANWTIQCADRYLAVLYDYLHEKLYGYHVLQADETPVLVNKDSRAYLALTMIQAIYREEKLLKDLPAGERMIRRQLSVKPLVEAYFTWVRETLPKVPQKSKTWEGFGYSLNQEKYLKVFLDDGEVPMDNNATEQSIRGFCIGKKNWVMIDTVAGAKSSAIIYSIAETAKANNLKPYDYFEHLLTEIPKHLDDKDRSFLDDLLPWSPGLPENPSGNKLFTSARYKMVISFTDTRLIVISLNTSYKI